MAQADAAEQATLRCVMFGGEKVTLRGVTRADLPVLLLYSNDAEVDLAAGDLPSPTSMERLAQ